MTLQLETLYRDCKYFFLPGDRPCTFHKQHGTVCDNCTHYTPIKEKILIIKRDAMGDVLRTTFLLHIFKKQYPNAFITWIVSMQSRDVLVRNPLIDRIVTDDAALTMLLAETFDFVINLDLDRESVACASLARATQKKFGFVLDEKGCVLPCNDTAAYWLTMSAFDTIKKANRYTYQTLAARTCEQEFSHEPIIVPLDAKEVAYAQTFAAQHNPDRKPIVGLNIGSGTRWIAKRLPLQHWKTIATHLVSNNFSVWIFGGKAEAQLEKELLRVPYIVSTGTNNSVARFFALLNCVDYAITGDTMALHAALGLGKKVVALFGPTSHHEIEMYGQGIQLVTPRDCAGCYALSCPHEYECLEPVTPKNIFEALQQI